TSSYAFFFVEYISTLFELKKLYCAISILFASENSSIFFKKFSIDSLESLASKLKDIIVLSYNILSIIFSLICKNENMFITIIIIASSIDIFFFMYSTSLNYILTIAILIFLILLISDNLDFHKIAFCGA